MAIPTKPLTPEEITCAAARIIRRHLGAEYEIFLCGSRAKGTARRGSDYDIGIKGPTKLDLSTVLALKDEMDELPTLHKIDVIDFTGASESFKHVAKIGAKRIAA